MAFTIFHTVALPNILYQSIHLRYIHRISHMYICCKHSMQHIKPCLNNIILREKGDMLSSYICSSFWHRDLQYRPSRNNESLQRIFPFQNHSCTCQRTGSALSMDTDKAKVSALLQMLCSLQSKYSSQLDAHALLNFSFEISLPQFCTKNSQHFKNSPKWPCSYI